MKKNIFLYALCAVLLGSLIMSHPMEAKTEDPDARPKVYVHPGSSSKVRTTTTTRERFRKVQIPADRSCRDCPPTGACANFVSRDIDTDDVILTDSPNCPYGKYSCKTNGHTECILLTGTEKDVTEVDSSSCKCSYPDYVNGENSCCLSNQGYGCYMGPAGGWSCEHPLHQTGRPTGGVWVGECRTPSGPGSCTCTHIPVC